MNDTSSGLGHRWLHVIEHFRERLHGVEFCARHRRCARDFTRERLLTFPIVMLLLLQKTTKSVQRHVQSFFQQMGRVAGSTVTPGAWTQARAKLSHTALIELNQEVVLADFYAPEQRGHRRLWRGHRLLGCDGTVLRLPNHPEVLAEFGRQTVQNHHGETGTDYSPARLSVLYDLLNHLGLDAQLAPVSQGEVELALSQLPQVERNDVLIWDRGFTGFVWMAQTLAGGAHFIGRCSTGSYLAAQQLFQANQGGQSRVVRLDAGPAQWAALAKRGLPRQLTVRFVSVRLPDGELEVLVTSLLDAALYPTAEFLEVYHWRWQHETYHQMLKGRLDLENWSGQTLEAVRQDVQAAVLVSNLESLLSQPAQEELQSGHGQRQYPAQVNRAVSYHALKEKMLDLLWSDRPSAEVLQQLHRWMRSNPVTVRPDRKPPRRKFSAFRSYHHQRHIRKAVF
ncbi:MAG TPA: IS4 family transposase [Verrucomicrobiae bacterium]|nr:IS4 family transposase [Verrucomicrobiae bacterium]